MREFDISHLWFFPNSHNFADVVNQAGKLEPVQFGMCIADAFCRLKRVNRIRYIHLSKNITLQLNYTSYVYKQ